MTRVPRPKSVERRKIRLPSVPAARSDSSTELAREAVGTVGDLRFVDFGELLGTETVAHELYGYTLRARRPPAEWSQRTSEAQEIGLSRLTQWAMAAGVFGQQPCGTTP
jgi:hypothetical protein